METEFKVGFVMRLPIFVLYVRVHRQRQETGFKPCYIGR